MLTLNPADSMALPQNIKEVLLSRLSEGELNQWMEEAIVVEAARQHIISRRKAAILLGLKSYPTQQAFFERHKLYDYAHEMESNDLGILAESHRG